MIDNISGMQQNVITSPMRSYMLQQFAQPHQKAQQPQCFWRREQEQPRNLGSKPNCAHSMRAAQTISLCVVSNGILQCANSCRRSCRSSGYGYCKGARAALLRIFFFAQLLFSCMLVALNWRLDRPSYFGCGCTVERLCCHTYIGAYGACLRVLQRYSLRPCFGTEHLLASFRNPAQGVLATLSD